MTNFNDLPIEIIIDIIKEAAPNNEYRASVGNNAAWTSLEAYRESLKTLELSPLDETEPLPRSLISITVYSDLLSLRLTCSTLNALCTPIIYKNLDIIKGLGMSFDGWYDTVFKPNAQYVKTIRLSSTEASITDEQAAKIIGAATNADEFLLYHPTFKPRNLEQGEAVGWWIQTKSAIMNIANEGRLRSFGIYSQRLVKADWYWYLRMLNNDETTSLLLQLAQNPIAQKTLKRLDIALWDITAEEYDAIRQNLTSLTSLTFFHALRQRLGQVWSPSQFMKWAPNSSLTHLYLKKASGGYAPHIPHLVRHFTSLKHLLISICGDSPDDEIRPSSGWYQSKDALWKVHKPLDIFHMEHMDAWEIEAMAEIPTKTLVVANLRGYALVDALTSDEHYFPLLETIRVEPIKSDDHDDDSDDEEGGNRSQFDEKEHEYMEEYCRKRGIALLFDARPTAPTPRHH